MRLNVEIKEDVYDEFANHCSREGKSLSEVVRGLMTDWNAKRRREELEIFQLQEAGGVKNERGQRVD